MPFFLTRLIFALLLTLGSQAGAATLQPAPAIDISQLDSQFIRQPAEFLITDQKIGIGTLPYTEFKPLTQKDVNQGISGKAFWLRFQLHNASAEAVRWVLQHETSYIDNIEVYLQDDGKDSRHFVLSDRQTFDSRPLDYRTLAFKHSTAAQGETTVYLKLFFDKPDSISLNFKLSDASLFATQVDHEYFFYGGFYGAMLTLIVISLVGSLLLKQWTYLLYTVFLTCSTLMWALLNGFAYQFLWPGSVFWHNEGFHILYLLTAASAFVFSRQFLMTRLRFPRLDIMMQWLPLLMLSGVIMRFAGLYETVLVMAMLSIVSMILLSVVGLMAYRSGLTYARWYAFAWVIYGCGLTMSVTAASTSLLPWGMDSLRYAQLGAILEAVMLLMALADKLRGWEMDHQQVLKLVQQDELTGLSNRRVIDEAIHSLQNAFQHNSKPVYLALLDMDNFKQINDRYGHEAGDEVLRTLASVMQSSSRSEDVCIRQGGDEFMILFQTNGPDTAIEKIERIRRFFNNTHFKQHSGDFKASLSCGISPLLTSHHRYSQEVAFRQADQMLYQAKQSGGNQTFLFGLDHTAATSAPQSTFEQQSS